MDNKNSLELASYIADILESKKGVNPVILDLSKVSLIADYFVLCSADNVTLVKALADQVLVTTKHNGFDISGLENDLNNRWILLDFGDVVVHIMHSTERTYYDLESFWSHAPVIQESEWKSLLSQAQKVS